MASKAKNNDKLGIFGLTCLMIGSLLGGGLFDLMRDMAKGAGPAAVLISWVIAGFGAVCLGLTFKNLTMKRPDLNAGIYAYSEAGFGHYWGFNSALSYWLSNTLGNVGYAALLMITVGYFMPRIFGNGQNLASVVVFSIILWGTYVLIIKGVKVSAFVNDVITVVKFIPIILFIIFAVCAFKLHIFTADFWSTPGDKFNFSSIVSQVGSTLAVIFWCITGVESANDYAATAKHRSDIAKATVIGISTIILIYAIVTLLSFGIMNRTHLANLNEPAMAGVLKSIVGPWGADVVNMGLMISLLGAWLTWQMMISEVPAVAAEHGDFPKWFAKRNQKGVQISSLLITTVFVQIFIFSYLVTSDVYIESYTISSTILLIPYILSTFYQIIYTWKHPVNGHIDVKELMIGMVASIFSIYGFLSIIPDQVFGVSEVLMVPIVFALGIPLYCYLQKHDNHVRRIFTHKEWVSVWIILILAIGTVGYIAI